MHCYYIKESFPDGDHRKTAKVKAREDVERILDLAGYLPVTISCSSFEPGTGTVAMHFDTAGKWRKALHFLSNGDVLVIQFPVTQHSVFLAFTMRFLARKGVLTVLITHDLEILRNAKKKGEKFKAKLRRYIEEISLLKTAGAVIVHNSRMKEILCRYGISPDRMISLEIFDYLIPDAADNRLFSQSQKTDPVIIAGNLRKGKADYLYTLPDDCEYNLYGVGYNGEKKDFVHYFGAFLPEELPYALRGSFGLIWDGDSSDTCSGIHGDYLKINNPHKTSLYLASGHPVIVWRQSAIAGFVLKNRVGIAVDSLWELKTAINNTDNEEYALMCHRAQKISRKLRSGFYFRTALEKAVSAVLADG